MDLGRVHSERPLWRTAGRETGRTPKDGCEKQTSQPVSITRFSSET